MSEEKKESVEAKTTESVTEKPSSPDTKAAEDAKSN